MTAVSATATHLRTSPIHGKSSRLRVLAAPGREPAFDDEIASDKDLSPVVGLHQLTLQWEGVRAPRIAPHNSATAGTPVTHAVPHVAGDPAVFTRRLLTGFIETMNGRRPPTQIVGMVSRSVFTGISRDIETAALARRWGRQPVVRSIHVEHPTERAAEIAVTIDTGPRVRAAALRLELLHGQWRCVNILLG